MGKKHASQYANFGWLPTKVETVYSICNKWKSKENIIR